MTEERRFVVQTKLLGLDNNATRNSKGTEYAIEVVLSDESLYTMYRSLKEILNFHNKLVRKFKVEAGYFKKEERVIPDCPIKQSIFGPQRTVSDDKSFERLLSFYLKFIPGLPGALVKSDLVTDFFSLKDSDLGTGDKKSPKKKSKGKVEVHDDSLITGPVSLKSYYAVANYEDKKAKFSFKEGATVQLIQKDPGGWWMIDAQGLIGWAPASYLVPLNEGDQQDGDSENIMENEQEKVGTRYISIKSYQASRDDELSFVRGAVVKVLQKHVDGWWKVRYNGGEGMVPGALFKKFSSQRQASVYVGKIRRKYTHRGTTRIVPTVKPNWMTSRYEPHKIESAKKEQEADEAKERKEKGLSPVLENPKASEVSDALRFRVCMGDYNDNGLNIKEGDKIEVVDNSEDDWWFVVDCDKAKGWAPANYFQPAITDHELAEVEIDVGHEDENKGEDSMDELDNDSIDLEDCYVAISNYSRASLDELDLRVGQMVCVIDNSDPDIWYVNMEGKEGWVPSNALEIMNEDELSSSESTPSGLRSGTISADNSDLSDDGIKREVKIRRPRKGDNLGEFRPMPRPRSRVIHKSPSPQPEHANRVLSSSQETSAPNNEDRIKSIADKLDQLEREADEAEKMATEARKRAQQLREQLDIIKT